VTPYSGQPRRRRPVALVATMVIVVGLSLVWLVWAAFGNAREPKVQVLGYQVDGQSVTVRFEVVKPADTRVECLLRARDASGLEIARQQVMIESGLSRAVVSRRLVGTAVPVTGEVTGCHTI
jgi:hypothetical protein